MKCPSFSVPSMVICCLSFIGMVSRANTIKQISSLQTFKGKIWETDFSNLHKEVVKTIAVGILIAHDQCRQEFKWEKWNCTEIGFSRRFMSPVNREMAYVAAITAAGIAYSVARACSRGTLGIDCRCPKSESGEECSRDLEAGQRVALQFLDNLEHGAKDINAKVNRHNYILGVRALELESSSDCRCHGMSGACTTRTCFGRVASFSRIGKRLKTSYAKGLKVAANRNTDLSQEYGGQMLFLEDSPDYCTANATLGWYGTEGRLCARSSGKAAGKMERRPCRELCRSCGLQVRHRVTLVASRCKCEFVYCCKVSCSVCFTEEHRYYCDASPSIT